MILFGTVGCHLCDEAEGIAAPIARRLGYRLRYCDIADDPQASAEMETRIPILEYDGRQLCWPFDAARLYRFLL